MVAAALCYPSRGGGGCGTLPLAFLCVTFRRLVLSIKSVVLHCDGYIFLLPLLLLTRTFMQYPDAVLAYHLRFVNSSFVFLFPLNISAPNSPSLL